MPSTLLKVATKSAAGPDSGVARATEYAPRLKSNVSDTERLISLGVGGALLLNGALGRHFNLLSFLAGGALVARAATGNCMLYQALGVSTAGGTGPNTAVRAGAGVKLEDAVTIQTTPDEAYRYWRNFTRLPLFMEHLRNVEVLDETRSRWTANAPLGMSVQWEAEIISDDPGRLIAWKSLPGSDVDTAGSVHFDKAPGGRGVVVRVSLKFDPPAGKLGSFVARLFGENPQQQVKGDLARFKALLEAGEIPNTTGQPSGRR